MSNISEFRLRYLLDKCMSGKETELERMELNEYLTNQENLEKFDAVLLESFYQPKELTDISADKQEQMLESIFSAETNLIINHKKYYRWIGIASIFLGVIFSVIWIGKEKETPTVRIASNEKTKIKRESPAVNEPTLKDREPARKTAVLEMANGASIELAGLDSGRAFQKNGVSIQRTGDGIVLLKFLPENKNEIQNFANNINSIKTPRGGTYKVILSDGTMVYLNSDSKLSFPTFFGKNERRVKFEGEGYFDVAKDKNKQFVVTSNIGSQKQEIRVFGTEFNVSAYRSDNNIKTTLIEGNVKIKELGSGQEIQMKPNDLVELGNGGLIKEVADIESSLAWKNNKFYFANEPINRVLKQISRWYDIDIIMDENLPQEPVWGQISRDKRLSEVLEILSKTNRIQFDIKGKEVRVRRQ